LREVTKREDTLKAAELKVKQIQAQSKRYEDVCKDVKNLGEKINDAVHEMKTLVVGKGHPERAFMRWENTHCGPDVKAVLVQLSKQHRIEEEVLRAEHAERLNIVLGRGLELSELTIQKDEEIAKAKKERSEVGTEREKIRIEE
jgi:hypothetical protein